MKTIIYYYRGGIERGNGKPGYDWHAGYSENTAEGATVYPWSTCRECQAEAKARGAHAEFVDSRKGAPHEPAK